MVLENEVVFKGVQKNKEIYLKHFEKEVLKTNQKIDVNNIDSEIETPNGVNLEKIDIYIAVTKVVALILSFLVKV